MFELLATVALVCNVYNMTVRCDTLVNLPPVVSIQNADGHHCTGFIVHVGYVVTANHCLRDFQPATATLYDGRQALLEVIAKGGEFEDDFAIYKGDTGTITPLPIAARYNDDEFCSVVGYTGTSKQHKTHCQVLGKNKIGLISLSAQVLPGDSGSPVLNNAGEVIGVAVRSEFPEKAYGEMVDFRYARKAFQKLLGN